MTQKRSQRMKKLVDIETKVAQPLLSTFKAEQVNRQQQQQALDDLLGYRDEYSARFKATGGAGVSSFQMQDFHVFLQKLDDAIAQQRQALALTEQQLQVAKGAWQQAQQRVDALQKVTEQSEVEERATDRKHIQRQLEDRFGLSQSEAFSS